MEDIASGFFYIALGVRVKCLEDALPLGPIHSLHSSFVAFRWLLACWSELAARALSPDSAGTSKLRQRAFLHATLSGTQDHRH